MHRLGPPRVALDSKIQLLPLALQHRLLVALEEALELLLQQHPLDLLHQLLVALAVVAALGLQLRLQALEVALRLALRLLPLPPLVVKEEALARQRILRLPLELRLHHHRVVCLELPHPLHRVACLVLRHRRLVDLAATREADLEEDLEPLQLQLLLALGVVDLPLDRRHQLREVYLELRHPHPVALVVKVAAALGPRPHQVRLERQLQPQEACMGLLLPPPQEGGCMELRRRAEAVVRKWHPLLSPHDRMDPRQSICYPSRPCPNTNKNALKN
jgi:hypothetical protein